MTDLRLGVIADVHASIDRVEDASWHNPFRLADAHDRFATALAHPYIANADAVVVLGDLAHFGDADTLRVVAALAAEAGKPTVLLSGNHDVMDPDVRLETHVDEVASDNVWCALGENGKAVADAFGDEIALELHEVRALARTGAQPFDVSHHVVIDEPERPLLLLTHFPLLSLEAESRSARLLYSGHLDQLAPPPGELDANRPTIILSGHLHTRGTVAERHTLQLCFAALVEAPYEVASVELRDGGREITYQCESVAHIDAEQLPILCDPRGHFTWSETGWS